MQRTDSLKKTQMLAKIEGRRRGQQRMRWLNSITDLMDLNLNNFLEFSCGRASAIWLLFSNFGVAHPAGVWFDLIMIVFFISSHCGLYFVSGWKNIIFGRFQSSLLDGCSAFSCNIVVVVVVFERAWVNVFLLCHFVLFPPCSFINECCLQTFQYIYIEEQIKAS